MKAPSVSQTPSTQSPFLTTFQAALYLSVSKHTLEIMRIRGDGPVFIKLGPKRVVYTQEDLDAWVGTRRRISTADPGPRGLRH